MTIDQIAQELIALKLRSDEAEREYKKKRDAMYGALATQPDGTYVSNGYKFVKTQGTETATVTKQSVIEALQAADLPQEKLDAIIGAALVDGERGGGLRIIKL